jgi:hypothetical protein
MKQYFRCWAPSCESHSRANQRLEKKELVKRTEEEGHLDDKGKLVGKHIDYVCPFCEKVIICEVS